MIDIDSHITNSIESKLKELGHYDPTYTNVLMAKVELADFIKQLIREVLQEVKPDEVRIVNPDAQAEAYINGYGKAVYNFEKKAAELNL